MDKDMKEIAGLESSLKKLEAQKEEIESRL
jgi:hypothetical protein